MSGDEYDYWKRESLKVSNKQPTAESEMIRLHDAAQRAPSEAAIRADERSKFTNELLEAVIESDRFSMQMENDLAKIISGLTV